MKETSLFRRIPDRVRIGLLGLLLGPLLALAPKLCAALLRGLH